MFFLLLKKQRTSVVKSLAKYSEWDLNPHSRNGQGILSPSCLPIPPSEQLALVDILRLTKVRCKDNSIFCFMQKNIVFCHLNQCKHNKKSREAICHTGPVSVV